MKLSFIIEAVDKASQNMKKITGNVRDLGQRGMGPLARATEMANRRTRDFGRGFAGRLAVMTTAAARFAGRAGLMAIERSARAAGRGVMWMVGKAGGLALQGAKWAAAGAGVLGGFFTAGVIGLASQFEQFQVILENAEGSSERARRSMSWVKDFATTTPYEIADVMDAFVQLRVRGFDPMSGTLRALGDAASGLGEPLGDAVGALASAVAGEYEPLRRFGIQISKNGDQLVMTFLKNGKEIKRSARDTAREIEKTVSGILGERFAGMMDRQSRTLSGMWRNLMDLISKFQLDIADAGFFDVVKGKVQQLLHKVNELAANGTLAKWAKNVSTWLSQATEAGAKFIQGLDWKQLGSDLKNVGTLLWGIVKILGVLGKLVADIAHSFRWLSNNRTSDLLGLTTPKKELPFSAPKSTGKDWPARMSNSLQPVARRLTAPLLKQPPALRSPKSSSSSQIGGKAEVTVKVEAAAGSKARVTRVSSNRPDLTVSTAYRGRAMAEIG